MGSDGIYRKTEKGRYEIATRASKLGLRQRTLLIMVDDKTPRSVLMSRSAHPGTGDILDSLLEQGFIEITPGSASGIGTETESGKAAVEISLQSAASFASRSLEKSLGPPAAELIALIEKSGSAAELGKILGKCREIIQSVAGQTQADDFWAGVSARLPKA